MNPLFPDSDQEFSKEYIEMMRKLSPGRKLEMVGEMFEAMKANMMADLKIRYPNDHPEILRRRLADLLLGPELAAKAYGEFPEEHK